MVACSFVYIERRGDGQHRAVVKHQGRRRNSPWVPTRAEAQMRGAELLIEMGATPSSTVTVDALLTAHLAAIDGKLADTTVEDYLGVAGRLRSAAPVFVARQVAETGAPVVEALYRQLERAGWSPHRLARLHDLLSTSWRRAVRYGWAASNPLREVERPRIPVADIVPPATADVARLLDAAPDEIRTYLRVAAVTGARRGELVALQWDDVRWEPGELVIRRSQSYTARAGVRTREGKTGRKGHRVVALGDVTLTLLRRHRAHQVETALAHGLPDPLWVFSHDAGVTPWRPDYATMTVGRLRDRLGLRTVNTKALRHYVATQMLADGETAVQVAGRLGHSNPSTTLRVYAHWVRAADRTAAERFDERLG